MKVCIDNSVSSWQNNSISDLDTTRLRSVVGIHAGSGAIAAFFKKGDN